MKLHPWYSAVFAAALTLAASAKPVDRGSEDPRPENSTPQRPVRS
jgi:hypothetical protein